VSVESEMREFVALLHSHLARLITEATPYLRGLDRAEQRLVMQEATLDAWSAREAFDPRKFSLARWFGGMVKQVLRCPSPKDRFLTTEEHALLEMLTASRSTPVRVTIEREGPRQRLQETDPIQKIGKDCPPCWRCMYFYGWLPKEELTPTGHSDPEVAAACDAINHRKIAIAGRVRYSAGWSEKELSYD